MSKSVRDLLLCCHTFLFIRTCCINDQCQSIAINDRSNFRNWSKIQLNWSALRSIEKYWSILIVIDRHWYLLIAINTLNLIRHWLLLIDIDHWYSMSWFIILWMEKSTPVKGYPLLRGTYHRIHYFLIDKTCM